MNRSFGWREGFTRRERGPLAVEGEVVEGHRMLWRSIRHEALSVIFVFLPACLVMPREVDVKGELPLLPQLYRYSDCPIPGEDDPLKVH
jgi:hypothetical protein